MVQVRTRKFASEIYWPLAKEKVKYYSLPTAFMRVLQSPDMLFMDIPWKTGGWGFYLPMIIMVLEPCVWLETISHTTDHLFGFSFSWSPPLIAIHINRVGFLHLPTFTTYLCRYTAKISTVDMHQSDLWSEIRIRPDLIYIMGSKIKIRKQMEIFEDEKVMTQIYIFFCTLLLPFYTISRLLL